MPKDAEQALTQRITVTPSRRATLTDLLDRVLDKGLIIDADIIITLAGIPLVGVKLRAAIAGIETMLRYGLMNSWDKKIREETLKETLRLAQPLIRVPNRRGAAKRISKDNPNRSGSPNIEADLK